MRKEKSELGLSWAQSGEVGALQVNFTFPSWGWFCFVFYRRVLRRL